MNKNEKNSQTGFIIFYKISFYTVCTHFIVLRQQQQHAIEMLINVKTRYFFFFSRTLFLFRVDLAVLDHTYINIYKCIPILARLCKTERKHLNWYIIRVIIATSKSRYSCCVLIYIFV